MREKLRQVIAEADMILVGIGEEWETNYKKMRDVEPFQTWMSEIEQKEACKWLLPFLRAFSLKNICDDRKMAAYQTLQKLLQDKNYFMISLCTDGVMRQLEWKEGRTVYPCGGYELLQCSACDADLIDADELLEQVICACETNVGSLEKVTPPLCEKCGKPLCFHNVLEADYNEKEYLPNWELYRKWLQGTVNRKLCILELGVGLKYPSVIRFPFEKVAYFNQKADFFRIHSHLYQLSAELSGKGYSVAENPIDFLQGEFVD